MVRFEDSDDARAAPSHGGARVVHVTRDYDGVRTLRMPYDRRVVDAIKGCRDGRAFARWDPDSKTWSAPRDVWFCVNAALVAAGFEVHEVRA